MRVIAFGADDYPAARSSTLEVCQSRPACIRSNTAVRALAHPVRFDRKTVRFRAKYGGTWEGRWRSDDHADDHCDGGVNWCFPDTPNLPSGTESPNWPNVQRIWYAMAWRHFDSSSRRLYGGMSVTRADGTIEQGDYDCLTADFTGVLVLKRNFHFKNGFGNGWGHLAASRFLLLLRSVHDVSVHPCVCPPRDLPPPVVQFQPSPPEVYMPTRRPR